VHEEAGCCGISKCAATTPAAVHSALARFRQTWAGKWSAVIVSLDEAGVGLTAFTAFPPAQWRCLNTTNVIERIVSDFRRRTKPHGAFPTPEAGRVVGDARDGRDATAEAARLPDDEGHHAATRNITRDRDRITRTNFYSLRDTTAWRGEYNAVRPHSSLGRLTPQEYEVACQGKAIAEAA
jgi:hypothetical protein